MAKIKAPNEEYNGISAGTYFVNGEAETDNPHLIEWFKEKGYEVEMNEVEEIEETQGTEEVEESKEVEEPNKKSNKSKK